MLTVISVSVPPPRYGSSIYKKNPNEFLSYNNNNYKQFKSPKAKQQDLHYTHITIMYIYHALINALSAHMIYIT